VSLRVRVRERKAERGRKNTTLSTMYSRYNCVNNTFTHARERKRDKDPENERYRMTPNTTHSEYIYGYKSTALFVCHTCMCIDMYTDLYTYTYIYMCMYMNTYIYVCIYIYIYIDIYIYLQIYVHI